jgi:hypothetical protein
MIVKNITPPPPQQTFSIELTQEEVEIILTTWPDRFSDHWNGPYNTLMYKLSRGLREAKR